MKTTWSKIQTGDIILALDGHRWTIDTRDPEGRTAMTRADGKKHEGTPAADAEVELVDGAAMTAAAVNLAEHAFGAVVVARQRPDGVHIVPAEYASPATLLSHLSVFHNLEAPPEEDLNDLRRVHENAHARENTDGSYEVHVHDDDWKETLSEA